MTEKGNRQKNRLEYSAINASVAMVSQALMIVFGYISRVVFVHTLSASYAGVNGLFADILGVLSLSELGIASAMSYALYRPIAENDIPKIQAVMKLYKRLYICVASFVGTVGLGMLPFLGWLAGDLSAIGHLELIYLLYLASSVFVATPTLLSLMEQAGMDATRGFAPTNEQMIVITQLLTENPRMYLDICLPMLCLLLMLAVMIFVGLRGNKMYMKHCVRTVRQVKAANLADEPNMTLDARGGVNPSIAVCIFVCYFLLVNVVPLLL